MRKLINEDDILQASKLDRLKIKNLGNFLMKTLKLEQVNEVYEKSFSTDPKAFLDTALDVLGVQFKVRVEELANLPENGAFITVSNHPYGGIDGMILLRLLLEHREDFQLMANFLLEKIEPLSPYFMSVNPFSDSLSKKKSMSGMRAALEHLKEGRPLGLFPAGEVSAIHNKHITDKKWNQSTLRLIQKAEVPIVPIYFQGRNSVIFHLLGLINPTLRTIKLPSELLNKQNRTVEIRIGHPISVKEQSQFKDVEQFGRYVRSKTYALGTPLEVRRFFRNSLKRKKTPEPIQEPQPSELITKEIESLSEGHKLLDSAEYSVYCAPSTKIAHTLQEIGRLRELTYREVGEGTNHACDLDEFDLYYEHLIIWDRNEKQIVGGYRIGKGEQIMHTYGVRGFYLHQLFKLKRPLHLQLRESLELGRSYIVKDYQRKPLPLFLLWKGILVFLLKNPQYRYLTGPVSISNQFSGFSKGILIQFLKRNFYDHNLAQHVRPRKKFRIGPQIVDVDILLQSSQKDLSKLDNLIQDIEPLGLSLPVLFKKYLKQNARVIGFNTDPKFNNALDGLMILDIYDVPTTTLKSLMKEVADSSLTSAMKTRNLVA